NASPSEQWKHSHNELHHTYTNVIGKDNDLGYGIMRVDEDQRWVPLYIAQPLWNFINACFFVYGIAAYDLELGKNLSSEKRRSSPSTTAPRTCRATATPRSPRGCRRCSRRTPRPTSPARCPARSPPRGTRSSGSRSPTTSPRRHRPSCST